MKNYISVESKLISKRLGVSTLASRTGPSEGQSLQKSLHVSNPDKIEKKISSTSENRKHANAQPNDRQKTVAVQTPKPLTVERFNYSVDRRPACNSTNKKLAVQWLNRLLCFVSSFVLAGSFLLRNRPLLVTANRYILAGAISSSNKL